VSADDLLRRRRRKAIQREAEMSSVAGSSERSGSRGLRRGVAVQANVIGALIMRELHTRYGRENIGYLWMVLEPMTLATAVSSLHFLERKTAFGSDITPVPFAICGYCVFIIFRQIVSRSEGLLESNAPLLYHRMVTLFDMVIARSLLESAGVVTTFVILMCFSAAFGLADPPVRPLALMAGIALMIWISFAMSLIVCSVTNENRLAARLVHPILYILMPTSGAFFRVDWLPYGFRHLVSWFPLVQIFELVRYGQFRSATETWVNPLYLVGCCLVLTWIGMTSLKVVRRHIHLH
jgi:capsular polysaccharide transport system permease protein